MEMVPCSFGRFMLVLLLAGLLVCSLSVSAESQGLQQSPYSAADMVRRTLDLAPSIPLGLPGGTMGLPRGSDSLYVSDGMLRSIMPLIPNVQFGYLYDFGHNRVNSSRFTAWNEAVSIRCYVL
jgi:hypothetical protein